MKMGPGFEMGKLWGLMTSDCNYEKNEKGTEGMKKSIPVGIAKYLRFRIHAPKNMFTCENYN